MPCNLNKQEFLLENKPYSKLTKLTTGAGMVQKIKANPPSQVKK
jgi:hypothetical protein